MKILLLNAGAKNNGATQEILKTIKTELTAENSVTMLCLGDMKIGYCKGCKVCYKTRACVQKDDVDLLIDTIDASDALVVAAPSYWADIPGQFKVFIDRCTAYSETNPNSKARKKGIQCYAIALRTGTRPVECQHIIDTIAHWCGHMHIKMAGSLYFCEINSKEDICQHKPMLAEKAKEWFSA